MYISQQPTANKKKYHSWVQAKFSTLAIALNQKKTRRKNGKLYAPIKSSFISKVQTENRNEQTTSLIFLPPVRRQEPRSALLAVRLLTKPPTDGGVKWQYRKINYFSFSKKKKLKRKIGERLEKHGRVKSLIFLPLAKKLRQRSALLVANLLTKTHNIGGRQ